MKFRAVLFSSAAIFVASAAHAQAPNVPSSGPGISIGTVAGAARDAAAAITAETGAAAAATAAAAQNGVNASAYLVCDGTTDNATNLVAWQAAIAASSSKTGYLPPQGAACLTSASLQPVSGETITAVPGTAILKPTATSTAQPLLLNAANVSNVLIYGLTFDGNLAALSSGSTALTENVTQLYSTTNVVFDHVTWQNTRGLGLEASTNVVNSGVRDSVVYNVGMFWQTSGSTADQIQGLSFSNGSGNLHNFVTGTRFNLTGLDAINAVNQTSFVAANNVFYQVGGRTSNGGACFYGNTDTDVHVVDNQCDTPYGNGYDVINVTGFEIAANSVDKAGGGGVQVSTSSQGVVTGNKSLNGNQAGNTGTSNTIDGGVVFGGAISAVVVAGNVSGDDQGTPTQQYGIEFLTGTITTTCTNCVISQSNALVGNAVGPFGGGAGFTSSASQVFTSSGTFVVYPTSAMVCHIDMGAGGGGGGGGVIAAGGSGSGGAGGGAGTYQGPICKPASSYGSSVAVTVGAAGLGGASAGNGGSGGASQFGADPAAQGGGGGGSGGSGRVSAGGDGSGSSATPAASNGATPATTPGYAATGGVGVAGTAGYGPTGVAFGNSGSGSGATGAASEYAASTVPSGGSSGGGFSSGTPQAGGYAGNAIDYVANGAANTSGAGGSGATGMGSFPFSIYASVSGGGGGAGTTTGGAAGACPTGGAGAGGSGGGAGETAGGAGAAGCPGAILAWQY